MQLSLVRGERLHVRIDDPGKRFLAARAAKTPGASVMVGVFGPEGMFHPLPALSDDDTGQDYEMAIPADTDLRFSASSGLFDMDDGGTGPAKLAKGNGQLTAGFKIPARSGKKTFNLRVSGVRP